MRIPTFAPMILLALALPAAAQLAPSPEQQQMLQSQWQALDTNHDNFIERDELQSHPALASHFDQLDANHDGKLSMDETMGAMQARFQAADTNHDGFIDKAEAQANLPRLARAFDRLDTNHDGKLSAQELQQVGGRFAGRAAAR